MFEKMGGFTELLLPNNILKQDSVLGHMVADIPEADWTDQVQIIGWLYQYYNSELKDDTFALLKKNVKITKERIPSATQLFTPDWIVRYMVENSLGRIYVDKRKSEGVYADGRSLDEMTWSEAEAERIATEKLIADKMGWKYYLPEAEQTQEVRKQLDEIQAEYANLDVKDIRVIDPCMGSGHILVYAFDVLMQIYEANGYSQRDAARSILQNNLYGLDIDDRAAQLAYFAVMMKARQYDRRIFSRGIQPHVHAIIESNGLDNSSVDYFTNNDPKLKKDFGTLMDELRDAKEYGSILNISQVDFTSLYDRVEEVRADISMFREIVLNSVLPLIQVAEVMAQKYDVVVTNPPYMGASGMGGKLNDFVKVHYPDSKSDLSTVFMEKATRMCVPNGYMAMINIPVWMFISSYEKLRNKLISNYSMWDMVHPGRGIFGSDFGTTTFVFRNTRLPNYTGTYRRLFDIQGEVKSNEEREYAFLGGKGKYFTQQSNYPQIPGSPIAYWVSKSFADNFRKPSLGDRGEVITGMTIGDNNLYLRLWHEVEYPKACFDATDMNLVDISRTYWIPYSKGGPRRNWYGNYEYLVNWSKKDNFNRSKTTLQHLYLKDGITWPFVTSGGFSARLLPNGFLWDVAGSPCFFKDEKTKIYALGALCSNSVNYILRVVNPTINVQAVDVARLPLPDIEEKQLNTILTEVQNSLAISKTDWDSYETSWDFKRNPLAPSAQALREQMDSQFAASRMEKFGRISWHYENWKQDCEDRFQQLKKNEEELNRTFIDIYGLQDELTPDVADKDVTVHRVFDSKDDVPESMKGSNYVRTMRDEIVSLISYAVGCMFGRYSLDKPGLLFAGYSKIERSTKTLDGDDPELEKFAKQNADGSVSYVSYYHEVNQENYKSFPIDTDNIIPICDDDYFDDDITGRFVKWVETVYGRDTLEENLKFIADALGGKGTPREVIRSYFLNDFYADHLKTYQKRPICWLFDSGKKNGFKALIYMHRYQSDLLARLRTDYVHEQQERYRTQLTHLADAIDHAGAAERVKLTKQQKKLQEQSLEIQKYEEKVHHLADQNIQIDLDDGVKHNYELFADVLAKIK